MSLFRHILAIAGAGIALGLCVAPVGAQEQEDMDPAHILSAPDTIVIEGERRTSGDVITELTRQTLEKLDRLPPEIQRDLLKEADGTRAYCEKNFTLSNFYDCSCYSMRMLGHRIDLGPDVSYGLIIQEGKFQECVSPPMIAGFAYQRCKDMFVLREISDESLENLCTCSGQAMIEKFIASPAADATYIDNLYAAAVIDCQRNTGGL